MNQREYDNRYFCAETFRDQNYNFSTPTYDTTYEYEDYDDYGYNDDRRGVCYDYDRNTGVCYDKDL
tara:strand:- start:814 stop:1011 length:198 start_codon:yes stop_codon:yes gene_type:complete